MNGFDAILIKMLLFLLYQLPLNVCSFKKVYHTNFTFDGYTIIGECSPGIYNIELTCHASNEINNDVELIVGIFTRPEITFKCYNKRKDLDDFMLPYFIRPVVIPIVTFSNCPFPQTTYAEVLKAVNIDVGHVTHFKLVSPPMKPLRKSFMEELNITSLTFTDQKPHSSLLRYSEVSTRPPLSRDWVEYLASLKTLTMEGVNLPTLPDDSLLEELSLSMGASSGALGGCKSLKILSLTNWEVPEDISEGGWLESCSNLHNLTLMMISNQTLQKVLTNARSIHTLDLNELPQHIQSFDLAITNAVSLERVEIVTSFLNRFTSSFSKRGLNLPRLKDLVLAQNDLMSPFELQDVLSQTPNLQNLAVTSNQLLDMCEDDSLWNLTLPEFKKLRAYRSATSKLCFKSLQAPSIDLLDFSYCNFEMLNFSELPANMSRGQLNLILHYNKISQVRFDSDYNNQENVKEEPRELGIKELHLKENKIKNFTARSLPDTIKFIDLADNKLSYIDSVTAKALFASSQRKLRLAGNVIVCDCKNYDFLAALRKHSNQVKDYNKIICAKDGQPFYNITLSTLCPKEVNQQSIVIRVVLPILLTFIALAALAIAIYFRYGQTIKVFLYARGLCLFWLKEDNIDINRPFDVFISFSHDDENYVFNELVPELEKNKYRTCIHNRDWIIGEWIPKQIAVSIDLSRRTLIVLSKNFVKSTWGMMEFRMAHASMLSEGRVRLIVVVLDDVVADESLDAELKAYLRTNTYLKTDDPWFWDKLKYALPRYGHVLSNNENTEIPVDVGQEFGPYRTVLSNIELRETRLSQRDMVV